MPDRQIRALRASCVEMRGPPGAVASAFSRATLLSVRCRRMGISGIVAWKGCWPGDSGVSSSDVEVVLYLYAAWSAMSKAMSLFMSRRILLSCPSHVASFRRGEDSSFVEPSSAFLTSCMSIRVSSSIPLPSAMLCGMAHVGIVPASKMLYCILKAATGRSLSVSSGTGDDERRGRRGRCERTVLESLCPRRGWPYLT